MKKREPNVMFVLLDELEIYGVDVDAAELVQLVRARLFPDPVCFDPLAWAEDEVIAHLHPDMSMHWDGFVDDDGPIEL